MVSIAYVVNMEILTQGITKVITSDCTMIILVYGLGTIIMTKCATMVTMSQNAKAIILNETKK